MLVGPVLLLRPWNLRVRKDATPAHLVAVLVGTGGSCDMLHACSIPGISESGMAPLSLTRGQCWPVLVGTSCVLAASLESASLQGRRARRLWSSPGRCQQCLRSCCIPRACESARAPLSPIRAQYVRCHLIPLSCRIVWMPECALVSLSPILQQSVRRQSVLRAVGHLGPRAHCGTTLANLVAACPAPVRPAFLSHCLGSVGPSLLPFWEQLFRRHPGPLLPVSSSRIARIPISAKASLSPSWEQPVQRHSVKCSGRIAWLSECERASRPPI